VFNLCGIARFTVVFKSTRRDTMNPSITHLIGRILLALIFIVAGLGKLAAPEGTAGYMQAMGVPTLLLWPTVALEILGGLALLLGFKTKLVAWALAAFTVLAALIFHRNLADQMQMVMFLKNLSIAGGLLILSVAANPLSVDARQQHTH
jgi:putative oxidoreductase